MFDPELYRDKSEVEEWKKRCPIISLSKRLQEEGLVTDAQLQEMEARVASEVEDAVAFAEAGTWEPVNELTHYVYSDRRA
jgi:TPP-dependent pyruvate/acetoin dehydrogenase alpha subunit